MEDLNLAISVLSAPLDDSINHFWEFPRLCYHFQALETFKFEYVADRPAGLLVFAFSTSSFVEIFPISYSMPYFSHFQFV